MILINKSSYRYIHSSPELYVVYEVIFRESDYAESWMLVVQFTLQLLQSYADNMSRYKKYYTIPYIRVIPLLHVRNHQ